MADKTYLDKYISDGGNAVISLKKLYTTLLVCNNEQDKFIRIPIDDFFLKYRLHISESIVDYELSMDMYYRPKLVSQILYGTTEMWLSLLRVNGMVNITEFEGPTIKIYDPSSISNLMTLYLKRETRR